MKLTILLLIHIILISNSSWEQIAPSSFENIDYLITFGKNAPKKWGDDDNTQIHFFVVPKNETAPVYIRVYDPEISGELDSKFGEYNTTCIFTVYGGKGVHSTSSAKAINPIKGYDKGTILKQKTFKNSLEYDKKWYSFGPLNPSEGEYSEEFGGYIFKIICKGTTGNDGNAYKYSLSYDKDKNNAVQNGNIFTYEMSFRLKNKNKTTAHVYPYITENIKSITQFNFDADNDILMRVNSIARKLAPALASGNGDWNSTRYTIRKKEINSTMDIQMIKKSNESNDMVIYIKNQYNQAMPLFSVPIGGKPKYLYNIKVKYDF